MKFSRRFIVFLVLFVISLFVVFFVAKNKNYQTGKTNVSLSLNGVNSFRKGIDLVGGVVLTYKIDFSDYENTYSNQSELTQAKNGVKKIIEQEIDRRVNALGVSDYTSNFKVMNGVEYLEVSIGGISDIEYAKQMIGKTVKLDFKLAYEGKADANTLQTRLGYAQEILKAAVLSGQSLNNYQIPDENIYYVNEAYNNTTLTGFIKTNLNKITAVGSGNYYPTLITGDLVGMNGWAIVKYKGTTTGANLSGENYNLEYVFVADVPRWQLAKDPKTNKILNGSYFLQALVEQTQTGKPSVRIDFNSEGKEVWCNITTNNVGKQLAIFVGDQKISDPTIQEPICGGSTQVTFGASKYDDAKNEAKQLVQQLNYTLPVPLVLSNEEKVSPSLGETALRAAIIAGAVGFVIVFVFMTFMYGVRLGILSMTGILVFLTILLAVVKVLDIALSLSGIAAIILSIGMAVDSNILIYERLKEELLRGKADSTAIHDAYDRSFLAIRDGNVTTGFIGVLLFAIGINVFKGFGTMMILNILLTLFVVVPLAKELLINFRNNK